MVYFERGAILDEDDLLCPHCHIRHDDCRDLEHHFLHDPCTEKLWHKILLDPSTLSVASEQEAEVGMRGPQCIDPTNPTQCGKCGQIFPKRAQLIAHQRATSVASKAGITNCERRREHHPISPRPSLDGAQHEPPAAIIAADRTCQMCGKVSKSPSDHQKHLSRKTPCKPMIMRGDLAEKFLEDPDLAKKRCPQCGRAFSSYTSMRRHVRQNCKIAPLVRIAPESEEDRLRALLAEREDKIAALEKRLGTA